MTDQNEFEPGVPAIYAMRGLPASGKSALARKLADDLNAVVVSRNGFRTMLFDTMTPGREGEKMVSILSFQAINTAIRRFQRPVIVDNCHLRESALYNLREMAEKLDVPLHLVPVVVPVDTCIRRDATRIRCVGEDVIRQMASTTDLDMLDPVDHPIDVDAPEYERAM